jgi:uncharacterized protein (TIGR03067 family)
VWLLVGCGGPQPNSGRAEEPGKWRVNTYQSPTVYLSETTAFDKLTPGQSITVDGLVTGWEHQQRPGERFRSIRLVGFRKTADPVGQKYFFACALPEGAVAAGFEGLRLENVARIQGTVKKVDTWVMTTPIPMIVLDDCKLVSVSNGAIPPPPPVVDAIKELQGKWRVSRIEGGMGTPKQYRVSEIRITDCYMTWTAPFDEKTGAIQEFGIGVDPGKSPREMNLYRIGYHMTPALYLQQGDSLRLCLQLPLDDLRENTPRPRSLEPGPDGQVVIVAERVK